MANVLIEESTLKDIGNAIRSKTGKTDLILPSNMATEISGITGGGSGDSSNLVKYVTFMNEDGTEEIFKMPVISGDDCKDPVEHGDIDTPTKESTNTINFTHSGWSLTSGESSDVTALQNVINDRIVYAAFSESVRYYTVRFYTEVGELYETVQVTYRGTANPTSLPIKSGYSFNGWSPSNENITEDTDCYAVWDEKLTFAGASWADIARISEAGKASTMFAVGDERIININGEDVTLVIAGFNHDDLADGSGKAGMSIIAKTLSSLGKTTNLPQKLYRYATTVLDDIFMQYLPDDLKSSIKPVLKECEDEVSSATTTVECTFNLFPISFYELGIIYGKQYINRYNELGTSYELYLPQTNSGANSRKVFTLADTGKKVHALLRGNQRVYGNSANIYLNYSGSVSTNHQSSYTYYRCFGFCI